MKPYLIHAGPAAAMQRPPAPRFLVRVTVLLEGGQREQYEGVYAHTFDAYEDAFIRFAACERVFVKSLGMLTAPRGVQ